MLFGQLATVSDTPPAVWLWWAARLAVAIRRTPDWLANVSQRLGVEAETHLDEIAWLAAAEVLFDWPQRLEAFLDTFQQVDKQKTTSTGVGRRFGSLLRHAAYLEELGHSAPADALRHYLLEHYDAGHLSGKVCLFKRHEHRRAIRQRPWITQTRAAKMLGLRHGTIAALVDREILVGKLHSAGTGGRSMGLVARESMERLKVELGTALDVQTVASQLGIGRHAVLELIRREVLPRAVRTAQGWKVPHDSVARLKSAYRHLSPGKPIAKRWISARQATRKFGPTGLTLGFLIELVVSKRLSARIADPDQRWHGIVVRQADLASLLPTIRAERAQNDGYPIHQLAKILLPSRPIKAIVLGKWIDTGLLEANRVGRARVVSIQEVERFRSTYCLADEACRLLNVSRATLSRWEVEGQIAAVYGKRVTPGAGFSLYRREDLLKVSRRRKKPIAAGQ